MPLNDVQFRALFANSPKAYQKYEDKFGSMSKLRNMRTAVGANAFLALISGFYPDQLRSLDNGLTAMELQQVGGMTANTLASLRSVNASWIKSVLKIITNVNPPPGAQVAPGAVNQTASNLAHANTVVTEVNGAGNSPRNLVFDAQGLCVAEINFANHGGTATSGHAHVYPHRAMPITGHHISGTPHFGNGDYPAGWRALPVGVNPTNALWT